MESSSQKMLPLRCKEGAGERFWPRRSFSPTHLRRYALRPFDTRWCYYSSERPLWNEPRPRLWAQVLEGERLPPDADELPANARGAPVCFTICLCDDHFLNARCGRDSPARPHRFCGRAEQARRRQQRVWEHSGRGRSRLRGTGGKASANLSSGVRTYLAKLGIKNPMPTRTPPR